MRYVVKLTCSKCDTEQPFTYVVEADSRDEASAQCKADNDEKCSHKRAKHTVVSVEPESEREERLHQLRERAWRGVFQREASNKSSHWWVMWWYKLDDALQAERRAK